MDKLRLELAKLKAEEGDYSMLDELCTIKVNIKMWHPKKLNDTHYRVVEFNLPERLYNMYKEKGLVWELDSWLHKQKGYKYTRIREIHKVGEYILADEEILDNLVNEGKLEIAKLVDFDNKKYDIAVLMYRPTKDSEYKLLDYLYGCENNTQEYFMYSNKKQIIQILRKKKVI